MSTPSVTLTTHRGALVLGFCSVALLGGPVLAFPPAPTFTIHGIARDTFGWSLKAAEQGTVVIRRNGTVIAEAPINEAKRPGENFRAQLAMDSNPAKPYRTGAQTTGTFFSIEVRFPNRTLPVASLTSDQRTIGEPGNNLFLDFSIGEDSDGDRIPDSWEWWQLSEEGIDAGDPRWSLDTLGKGDLDADGTSDYVEYLAGTFAFLTGDSLRLTIDAVEADGSARLHALLVVDKTYRIESSEDARNWSTASVRLGAPDAALVTTFTATETREVPIYSPVTGDRSQRFYRLTLVR